MSLEITQYSSYLFSANEALGFHNHILAETSVLPEATTGKVLAEYRATVDELKALLKNNQSEATMDELVKAADTRRDEAYINGLAYLAAMVKSVNADISTAATAIKAVFDKFPDIRRANNNTETGVLNNLIEDLTAMDSSTLELAGFTSWFTELDSAQKAFVEAVHNKNAASSSKDSVDLKSAKLKCDNAYKALVKRVNAIAEIESENENFDPTFINNVNAFIESVKDQAAKAATKSTTKNSNTGTANSATAADSSSATGTTNAESSTQTVAAGADAASDSATTAEA